MHHHDGNKSPRSDWGKNAIFASQHTDHRVLSRPYQVLPLDQVLAPVGASIDNRTLPRPVSAFFGNRALPRLVSASVDYPRPEMVSLGYTGKGQLDHLTQGSGYENGSRDVLNVIQPSNDLLSEGEYRYANGSTSQVGGEHSNGSKSQGGYRNSDGSMSQPTRENSGFRSQKFQGPTPDKHNMRGNIIIEQVFGSLKPKLWITIVKTDEVFVFNRFLEVEDFFKVSRINIHSAQKTDRTFDSYKGTCKIELDAPLQPCRPKAVVIEDFSPRQNKRVLFSNIDLVVRAFGVSRKVVTVAIRTARTVRARKNTYCAVGTPRTVSYREIDL
ncbi:hypothetical protein NHQ30_004480 [Ciborinia camelliae]|nr:hypothetical protein NHQ30_004480 [Ciborinia camelliae]